MTTSRTIFCKPFPPLKKRIVKRRYSDLFTPKQVYKLLTFNYIIIKTKIKEDWSDFTYDGIIVEYCEIPEIPSDI